MLRKFLYRQLFNVVLSRGKAFSPKTVMERGWKSRIIDVKGTNLHLLHKKSDLQPESKTAVLLAHPYLTEGRYFFIRIGIADLYLQSGVDVFITDFNGFGRSPFRDFDFEQDILHAGAYIQKFVYDKIILHGVSFGAAQSILACTAEQHPFDLLVVENCLDENVSYFKIRNKILFRLLQLIHYFRPAYAAKHRYYEQIARLTRLRKVVFIYGDADSLTSPDMGRLLAKNCNKSNEFHLLHSRHLEGIIADHKAYELIIKGLTH
jgi:pimeloyl-ACP methyl ester carboxylesterase